MLVPDTVNSKNAVLREAIAAQVSKGLIGSCHKADSVISRGEADGLLCKGRTVRALFGDWVTIVLPLCGTVARCVARPLAYPHNCLWMSRELTSWPGQPVSNTQNFTQSINGHTVVQTSGGPARPDSLVTLCCVSRQCYTLERHVTC